MKLNESWKVLIPLLGTYSVVTQSLSSSPDLAGFTYDNCLCLGFDICPWPLLPAPVAGLVLRFPPLLTLTAAHHLDGVTPVFTVLTQQVNTFLPDNVIDTVPFLSHLPGAQLEVLRVPREFVHRETAPGTHNLGQWLHGCTVSVGDVALGSELLTSHVDMAWFTEASVLCVPWSNIDRWVSVPLVPQVGSTMSVNHHHNNHYHQHPSPPRHHPSSPHHSPITDHPQHHLLTISHYLLTVLNIRGLVVKLPTIVHM